MVDFRSHFFSILSIFFALSVGLLIGSLMLGGPAVVEKQEELIRQLQSEFERLRLASQGDEHRIAQLDAQHETLRQAVEQALPQLEERAADGRTLWVVGDLEPGWWVWVNRLPWAEVRQYGGWREATSDAGRPPDLILVGGLASGEDVLPAAASPFLQQTLVVPLDDGSSGGQDRLSRQSSGSGERSEESDRTRPGADFLAVRLAIVAGLAAGGLEKDSVPGSKEPSAGGEAGAP